MNNSNDKKAGLLGTKQAKITLLVVVAVGILYGGWVWLTMPPAPWYARFQLNRYLKKESHTSNFKVDIALPSKEELAKAGPKQASESEKLEKDFDALCKKYYPLKTEALVSERQVQQCLEQSEALNGRLADLEKQLADPAVTNATLLKSNQQAFRENVVVLMKKADTARVDLQKKNEAVAPVAAALLEIQAKWRAGESASGSDVAKKFTADVNQFLSEVRGKISKASTYADIYKCIGQEVWLADTLLGSANPAYQRIGITVALDATRRAMEDAQNGWIAARICDGYIVPHLDLAMDTSRNSTFNRDNLMGQCINIYRQNLELNSVARMYEGLLARADNAQRKDYYRSQLAMISEESGQPKQAVKYLKAIQNTNDYRWVLRRLPALEQEAKR